MNCPENYTDAMQSDSDSDPSFTPDIADKGNAPSSPPLSGGCSAHWHKRQREKLQKDKKDRFDKANEALNSKRNRITALTTAEDDDEIIRSETPPKKIT